MVEEQRQNRDFCLKASPINFLESRLKQLEDGGDVPQNIYASNFG